jgi:hypothetical protein
MKIVATEIILLECERELDRVRAQQKAQEAKLI